MKEIRISSQAEWDAIPAQSEPTVVIVTGGHVDVGDKEGISRVEAWGSSRVVARGSSRVEACGSSRVEAWDSSSVVARDSSSVVAWGSSSVVAWGSSRVEAWGSSRVVARGSSRVEACGSSRVEAWDSSRVEAWDSSRVEAWGSSSVVARGSCSVHVQSDAAAVTLFAFAVAIVLSSAKTKKRSKTATIVRPKVQRGATGWLEREGIKPAASVVVFKRVSSSWLTQENTPNQTLWQPGTTLEHADWDVTEECGAGKFHACSRPYFCDEFRSTHGDRYVAIKVAKKDLHVHEGGQYPHKVAFRKGTVLHEVDRWGDEVKS